MATEITMPKLSDTMTEGRLVSWKKGVGEKVERGEIIALVETDKATMELEAFASGVLLETRVKAGEMVPVGSVIGVIGEAREALAAPTPAPAPGKPAPAAEPPPQPVPAEAGEVPERVMELPEESGPPPTPEAGGEKASPMVRRLAREQGIDLSLVKGSGPDGRILREDLEAFLAEQVKVEEKAQEVGPRVEAPEGARPLSRMRAAIARTVAEAWRTIPHFSVTVEIDMGETERVRQELKEAGTAVTVNDLIVKAAALALQKFPRVNASFGGDRITLHAEINIGVAVALDDGLLVPVVRGCQGLSLKEIAAKSRDLVERARAGKISEGEIAGGTFSVSNLGMYGVEEFTAVIHPPQVAILAVGGIADSPVVRDGHIATSRIMRATLSADHRLLDGAYAAQFLQELKRVLENPVAMLV